MSKYSNNLNHSNPIPAQMPLGVHHLKQGHITDAIQKNPSVWAEILLPDEEDHVKANLGIDIKYPILGDQYRVTFWNNEIGQACFVNFLMNIHNSATLRVFFCESTQEMYIVTNANAHTVNVAQISGICDGMQEFGVDVSIGTSFECK